MSFSNSFPLSALRLPPLFSWLSALLNRKPQASSQAPAEPLSEEEAFLAGSTDGADCERRQRLLERNREQVLLRNPFL